MEWYISSSFSKRTNPLTRNRILSPRQPLLSKSTQTNLASPQTKLSDLISNPTMSEGAYITVSYPRTPTIKFNTDYYLNTHMAIVDKHWRQFGLKSWTVVQFPEGDPSGQHTQAIMHWESVESFEKALAANIPEVCRSLIQIPEVWMLLILRLVLPTGDGRYQELFE